MQITVDTLTNTATPSAATTVKAGSQVPVSVAFETGDAPATLTSTPGIELGLSGQSVPPRVLAYMDTFTAGASSTFTGNLDANDARLVSYMSDKATATLNLELAWTIGGERFIAPNMTVSVQQAVITGAQSSEGGPSYATSAQISAAVSGLSGSGAVITLPQATPVTLAPTTAYLLYTAPLAASAGSYTQQVILSEANASAGSILYVPIDFAAQGSGTVNLYDAAATGTLLQTIANYEPGVAHSFLFMARFDGAAWQKMDGHWIP